MKDILLTGARVYGENSEYQPGYIHFRAGKITALGNLEQAPVPSEQTEVIPLSPSDTVVPGWIDIHIHGSHGVDVMDGNRKALETLTRLLPHEGTTAFLATTMTQRKEIIENALSNVRHLQSEVNKPGRAELIGIHLEGPFLSEKKAGAQPKEHLLLPDPQLLQKWQHASGGLIRLVTLAPELDGAEALIKAVIKNGATVSLGHSACDYKTTVRAVKNGARQVTHLFNGMSPIHHRDLGLSGGALLLEELYTEVIADGIHVAPEMLRLIFKLKSAEKIILITDAIRAKGMPPGTYELGGQRVTVSDEKATLPCGTLAGSILSMEDAVRQMKRDTGCSMRDIIFMASVNPARRLGLFHRKGSLAPEKDADVLVLDENDRVKMTFCRGMPAS